MRHGAVRLIIKRVALAAADQGLVKLFGAELEAAIAGPSMHSLSLTLYDFGQVYVQNMLLVAMWSSA